MAAIGPNHRTQQTGALAILFVLLATLIIVIVLLAAVVIPDTAGEALPAQDMGLTNTTN